MKARPVRAVPAPARRRRPLGVRLRRALRWVLPALVAAAGWGGVVASRTPQGAAFVAAAADRALQASAALGLAVTDIEVEGRTTTAKATIMAALAAHRGTPILAVDPSRAQRELERLPWVRSARIERRLPGTLYVRLVERRPLAVWQHDGKQQLIDHEGQVIPVKDLGRFAALPTVVGPHAARHAAALLDMLAAEPALAAHVTAAVRVDGRRWNVRLDHRVDVLLPEDDPAGAWARFAAYQRRDDLLQRDIRTVDLRLPDRLVLRVNNRPGKQATPVKKAHRPGKST